MSGSIYHQMTVFCFLITVLIWLSALVSRKFADKPYFALNTAILLFEGVDATWGLLDTGRLPANRFVLVLMAGLYFLMFMVALTALTDYISTSVMGKKYRKGLYFLMGIVAAGTVALVIISAFNGVLYCVGTDHIFHRGPAYPYWFWALAGTHLILVPFVARKLARENGAPGSRVMYATAYLMPLALLLVESVLPEYPFASMSFALALIGLVLTVEYQQRKLLVDALNAAEHANRAKTTFLSNMSHDIRTPMNAIMGFTALAAAHVDNEELVKDYLSKISTSGQHLLSLINDVLDMSRIESGRVKIEEKEVHLPDVMHDLRTIVNANIVSKNIEFFIDAVDVENEDILCDKLRLNQILLNLLSNAAKFTKNGGQIIVRIIQRPGFQNGYATYEFHVKDNGIGMSKEFQKHLFEAFTREETATVSGIQGTGLGMAITKNIVDMMGGTITVDSEEGRGTEYTVTIPFKVLNQSAKYEIIPELKGVRVLVADDDSNTAISVSRMVQEIGMRAEWTLSGKEAVLRTKVAVEQNDAFGVYIIDWMMPDLNGIETVRRIRQLIGDSRPIIILTAYDWSDIEEEAREAGVTAFCSKPLFLSELRDILSQPYRVETPEETEQGYDFTGKKVLLVEDNQLNQEIALSILKEAGFAVGVADDGDVAVETLREADEGQYDLVLMDIQMPRMDGYTATRQIRTLAGGVANIPIIAMTANAFEEDRKKAVEAGMNGHVAKPIEVDVLMKTLARVLK